MESENKNTIDDDHVTVNTKKKRNLYKNQAKEPVIYVDGFVPVKVILLFIKEFIMGKSHFHVINVKSHSQ